MIELTTGVVFLMSSMYGSAQGANHSKAIANHVFSEDQVAAVVESSFIETNTPEAMEAYLRKEFADRPILVEIARCESNFKQFDENGLVVHGRVDSRDIGLMQINEHYQGDTAKKLGLDLYTLEGNMEYAEHLYDEQGTKPWNASSKCWNKDLARK